MISVIIPSYHSQTTIGDCLQSLHSQRTDEKYEILVINSSRDGTSRIVKDSFPLVRFFQLKRKVFAATARNVGIQNARGDVMAFIDADCSASSDWLDRMILWHSKSFRAVGGSIVNKSQKNIFSRAEYPLEIMEFSPRNPRREVKFVSAANCSFSREIFDKYGLFPEVRAGEDLVFCHKIVEKGEKILFDPAARVFHRNEINFKTYLKKQIMHGKYSHIIRGMAKLSGSFLNNPLLLPFLVPFMPLMRALRIIYRSLALRNKVLYDILNTFPIFFLGCIMWSFGYIKGHIEHSKKIY